MREAIITAFIAILGLAVILIALSWCKANSRREMKEMLRRYMEENKDFYNHQ